MGSNDITIIFIEKKNQIGRLSPLYLEYKKFFDFENVIMVF